MKNLTKIGYLILAFATILSSCKKNEIKKEVPKVYHKNGDVKKLYYNTDDGVNIVVLGDGFIKEDLFEGGIG